MSSRVKFDPIKEKHDGFYTSYYPPRPGAPFATLTIDYIGFVSADRALLDIERLAKKWTDKYPISIMILAHDEHKNLIDFSSLGKDKKLIVLKRSDTFEMHWGDISNDAFPKEALNVDYLLSVYSDLSYETQEEVDEKARMKDERRRWYLRFLSWLIILPAVMETLMAFSPVWVTNIAIGYSWFKAIQLWRLRTGRKKKSNDQIAKDKEAIRMKHHHYYCERDPEAFIRLRTGVLKRENKERRKKEYDALPDSNKK